MINFSKINNKTLLGKLIRLPLKLIPSSMKIRILQGGNKGYKWIVGSGVHGYYFGSYEIFKQNAITQYCRQGFVAYDIGAHVGFYTLLFARLVGRDGLVYSFEPNPRNLYYLERHIRLNQIENVKVFPIALARRTGVFIL